MSKSFKSKISADEGIQIPSILSAASLATDASGNITVGAGGGSAADPGDIKAGAYKKSPSGWLGPLVGQGVSRTTYSTLFDTIVPLLPVVTGGSGAVTVTIAAPAVVTCGGHGLDSGDPVYLTTTGALPTGLSQNTLYYAIYVTSNTFRLATTRANAIAGTAITTTGSQSGVHTMRFCPYGLGDGSTTFNLPRGDGSVLLGAGNSGQAGATAHTLGQRGGEETHQLTIAELASHAHPPGDGRNFVTNDGSVPGPNTGGIFGGQSVRATTGSIGSDTPHNTLPPYVGVNFFIKT